MINKVLKDDRGRYLTFFERCADSDMKSAKNLENFVDLVIIGHLMIIIMKVMYVRYDFFNLKSQSILDNKFLAALKEEIAKNEQWGKN